jgi:predicted DCC family thiol-disulfide oxidoreductase YuxK
MEAYIFVPEPICPTKHYIDFASNPPPGWDGKHWIVYDGECPFCSNYAAFAKLRTRLPDARLVNARETEPLIEWLEDRGVDLDEGMAVIEGNTIHHGAAAMTFIAEHAERNLGLGRVLNSAFRNPGWAAALYPVFRSGRNLVLKLLGRKLLKDRRSA